MNCSEELSIDWLTLPQLLRPEGAAKTQHLGFFLKTKWEQNWVLLQWLLVPVNDITPNQGCHSNHPLQQGFPHTRGKVQLHIYNATQLGILCCIFNADKVCLFNYSNTVCKSEGFFCPASLQLLLLPPVMTELASPCGTHLTLVIQKEFLSSEKAGAAIALMAEGVEHRIITEAFTCFVISSAFLPPSGGKIMILFFSHIIQKCFRNTR